MFKKLQEDPLYRAACDYRAEARKFLDFAEPIALSSGAELLEDIDWHHTIVPAKVGRAIMSGSSPEMRFDAVNSAAVAVNSLTISLMALSSLAPLYPQLEHKCKRLSLKAMELKQRVSLRFSPGS